MQRRIQVMVKITGALRDTSFRSMLQRQAGKLGVTGWVRNMPAPEPADEDGEGDEPVRVDDNAAPGHDVEAVFNGPEGNVLTLVRWCERGPMGPAVTDVAFERMGREAFFGFDVRH